MPVRALPMSQTVVSNFMTILNKSGLSADPLCTATLTSHWLLVPSRDNYLGLHGEHVFNEMCVVFWDILDSMYHDIEVDNCITLDFAPFHLNSYKPYPICQLGARSLCIQASPRGNFQNNLLERYSDSL